tara:strand:+ start:443 stop:1273 length:831 start_codon:yes stop_codon:yes gene_type:complete
MKLRHNKKRNTAFIYEALIVEATVSMLKKDQHRHKKCVSIIKKHFGIDKILSKELQCYKSLYENQNLNEENSRRITTEARIQYKKINNSQIFELQTGLINDINKNLGNSVFNNFVPNYKTLATISQLFSDTTSPKNKVILENMIVNSMTLDKKSSDVVGVDLTTINIFANKFNDKYDNQLLPEQKELLTYYISSFSDNALSLKTYLNEEILRLKLALSKSAITSEISKDNQMLNKANKIIEKLDSFAQQGIKDDLLLTVLKTQSLVKEIQSDGDSS